MESGFVMSERWFEDGHRVRATYWSIEGTVTHQVDRTNAERRSSDPWWWGVKDQTSPTVPWWKEEGR